MINSRHERGIQKILDLAADIRMPDALRSKLLGAARDILEGRIDYQERIQELEEQLLRNPAFSGDMVGWLDDDFDDDDPFGGKKKDEDEKE